MRAFEEGAIRLEFPATWAVLKYDDCLYYRGPVVRAGADLAAVDFVAVSSASALTLIEVKDFRGYEVDNRNRLASGELAVEVARKALDTLGGLFVGARANHADVRPLAAALLAPPKQLHVVSLLEEGQAPSPGSHGNTRQRLQQDAQLKRRGDLLQNLKTKLTPFRLAVFLVDCATVPGRMGWQAVALPKLPQS